MFAYAKTKPAVRVKSEHYRLRAKRALATECEAFYPMPLKPLCSAGKHVVSANSLLGFKKKVGLDGKHVVSTNSLLGFKKKWASMESTSSPLSRCWALKKNGPRWKACRLR